MSDTMVRERVLRPIRERVNLCGACATEIHATELLCIECKEMSGREYEDEGEMARRLR